MGTYLGIGLLNRVRATGNPDKVEELEVAMEHSFGFKPELYDTEVEDGVISWTLKPELLQEQLLPLLKTIYPIYYPSETSYADELVKVENAPTEQLIDLARMKSLHCFQYYDYNYEDLFLDGKWVNRAVPVEYILLGHEGKVSVEVFNHSIRLFRFALQKAFNNWTLSGALQVFFV